MFTCEGDLWLGKKFGWPRLMSSSLFNRISKEEAEWSWSKPEMNRRKKEQENSPCLDPHWNPPPFNLRVLIGSVNQRHFGGKKWWPSSFYNDGDGYENVTKKWIRVASNFIALIERFHVTSRRPYWCSKTIKRRPCWCSNQSSGSWSLFLCKHFPLFP